MDNKIAVQLKAEIELTRQLRAIVGDVDGRMTTEEMIKFLRNVRSLAQRASVCDAVVSFWADLVSRADPETKAGKEAQRELDRAREDRDKTLLRLRGVFQHRYDRDNSETERKVKPALTLIKCGVEPK